MQYVISQASDAINGNVWIQFVLGKSTSHDKTSERLFDCLFVFLHSTRENDFHTLKKIVDAFIFNCDYFGINVFIF